MADRSITIVLLAKNAIATGLASAKAGIVGFGKAVKFALSSSIGVIMAIYGAFKAVQRIIGWVTDALGANARAQREAVKAELAKAIEKVGKEYEALSKAMKDANEATKARNQYVDLEIAAYRKLADAMQDAKKARKLAGVAGTDTEAIQAIEAETKAADDRVKAERELQDLVLKRSRLTEEARANEKAAERLLREEKMEGFRSEFRFRQVARTKGTIGENKELWESLSELTKKSREARDKMLTDAMTAQRESARLASEAALVDVEILASKQARLNQLNEQDRERRFARDREIAEHTAAVAKQESDELLAAQKALNDQRAKLDEEMAKAKEDAAQKGARAELDALQKAEQERQRIAEQTVAGVLSEVQAKRRAESQWERDLARAERLRGRKGQAAQDFVRAVDQIKAARGQGAPMQDKLKAAEKALEEVGRKDRALDVIQREIDENRKLFKQLLGMG
jgi:hypothetical protein